MSNEYMSLTELGKLYGVSSHKIGKWLVDLGLRTQAKKPSPRAFRDGFVEQRPSTQPATYFWVWHAERTMKALEQAGFTKPANNGTAPADTPVPG
jgi:hypothetical protein